MSSGNARRLVAGAMKNGVVWGVAWFVLAFATILALRTIGVVVPASIGVLDAIGMAIRVGIVGGIAGGVFAAFIALFYRGRRLSEINWLRFGLGGAIVAELFMIAFFAIPALAPGGSFPPLGDILSDLIIAAVFGGIAAAGSMWLAQRVESAPDERPDETPHARAHRVGGDRPASIGAGDPLAPLDAIDARRRERAPRDSGGER
jgi:hypothetical protein